MSEHHVLEDSARANRIRRARERFDPGLVDRVARGLYETDVLADAALEALTAMPGRSGWRLLEQALESGVDAVADAPQELGDLLRPLENPPDWVDWNLIEAGTTAWWQSAVVNGFGLMATLVHGYQYADVIKPLAIHGRLETMAPRRLAETARWLYAAASPGGVRPGAEGFQETIRVRLMHATIRRHLRRSPRWDHAAWGEPVHATGGAATILAFVLAPLEAMERVGIRLSDAQHEAVVHQWRWIGTLMGVPDDLLPVSLARAWLIGDICESIFAPPDEDSRRLTQALANNAVAAERLLPAWLGDHVRPLARRTASYVLTTGVRLGSIDRSVADAMGVPGRRLHYALAALTPFYRLREAARKLGLRGSDERIAERQRAFFLRVLTRLDPDAKPLQSADVNPAHLTDLDHRPQPQGQPPARRGHHRPAGPTPATPEPR